MIKLISTLLISAYFLFSNHNQIVANEYNVLSLNNVINHIKHFEGFRSTPYRDQVNPNCFIIGYGKNIGTNKKNIKKISKEEADRILRNEVNKIYVQLSEYAWFNNLNTARKYAIIDLSYNIGLHWINNFKGVVAYLENEEYELAAHHLLYRITDGKKTKYAKQTGKRAKIISQIICDGIWISQY